MLPFFKKSHKDTTKFLTLEINSTFVKCLAVYQEDNGCKIIGHGTQKLEIGSVRGGTIIDINDVEEAVRIAVAHATKNLEEDISQTIVGVTGDNCMGIMTTVRQKRGTKEPINQKELDNIYKQIIEAAYMQIQNDYLNKTGNADIDLDIITTSNVYLKLDGHFVDSLEGKEGKIIEIAVFNAFSPKYHIESLEALINRAGLQLLAVGPELYALAQQLQYASLENTDYVIIDVSNDSTNVAVVFGKGIVATRNLNIGYTHFIEGLSEKMGLTDAEAENVLNAHLEERLTPGESAIVHSCILEILEIWLRGLELVFGEFSGVKTFAHRVYLTGTGMHIPSLVEFVEEEPWMKSIPFKQPPEFKRLDFMDLQKVSDSTGTVNTSEWIAPAALSIIFTEISDIKYDKN